MGIQFRKIQWLCDIIHSQLTPNGRILLKTPKTGVESHTGNFSHLYLLIFTLIQDLADIITKKRRTDDCRRINANLSLLLPPQKKTLNKHKQKINSESIMIKRKIKLNVNILIVSIKILNKVHVFSSLFT